MQGKPNVFFSIAVALLLIAHPLAAQEQHFTIVREGAVCGTVVLQVEHMDNGYVQYRLREEHTIITIADRNEDQLRTLTILADSALQMVSLEGMERQGTEEWKLHGSCVRGVMHLSREDAVGHVQHWRSDCAAVPDVMLPELIRRRSPLLPTKVFSTRDLQDHPAAVTIEQDGGTFRIFLDQVQEYHVDPNGRLLSWRHHDHGLSWEQQTKVAARQNCDLDCGVYWDLGQALLPTSSDNIRRMDVLLRLGGNVGARLVPVDARQEVREESKSDSGAVRLRINAVGGRFEEATLPLLDRELVPYLKGTDLLPVRDDRIRERAGILRNWDRNAAHVASDILRWCGEHFTRDAFIPVLPANRLVRDPRGGALQASILFVTLARSAGVPARFVLGLTIADGHWRSTVWAEAWSGDWVSVDPMTGSVLNDAVHVKLLHTADVAELRDQAARLRGALRIEVRNVEPRDPTAAGDLVTGILGRTYTNRSYRCSIRAPKGWLLEERQLGPETVLIILPELGSPARFEMHLFRNPYRLHTHDLFDTRLRSVLGVLEHSSIEEKGEMRLSERQVPYVVYSYRGSGAAGLEGRIRTADAIFSIADCGYILRFTAPADHFDAYQSPLQEILQSLQLYGIE